MTDSPVIGACVVPCQRCGQPMRVEVTADLSSIKRPGYHSLTVSRGGESIAECWWKIQPVGSDHRCPRRAPIRKAA